MKKSIKIFWLKIAFLFLIIGASMGLLMRMMPVFSLDRLDYGFLRQGHSHVAFLGWGYLSAMVLLIDGFLPHNSLGLKKYKWNFVLTVFFIAGMIFSFPLSGYKALSISLLILFLVASCIMVVHFWMDYRQTKPTGVSKLFVYGAFLFYLVSGVGPVALGPILIIYGKTEIYYLAVYFYLHFLYNGFFVFAIFALLMKHFEMHYGAEISFPKELRARRFFYFSFFACIPAYALSTLWTEPPLWVFVTGGTAAVFQLIGLICFLPLLRLLKGTFSGLSLKILSISMMAFLLKLLMQLLSALPWFAIKSYQAKSFVIIGYIHLVVLGFITFFLLTWIIEQGAFKMTSLIQKSALMVFALGFFLSESLLFFKGLNQWFNYGGLKNFHELLLVFSTLMPLGLLVLWAGQRKNNLSENGIF